MSTTPAVTTSTKTTTVGANAGTEVADRSVLSYLDPAILVVGENVRLDLRLDKQFVASIRERGVLQPIHAYRNPADPDAPTVVVYGQRRTLAAREAGCLSVPVIITDTPPAETDRLVDQWVENEHRAGLTNSEKVAAVEQMVLAGLSDAQIAKRTATRRAEVKAAHTIADSSIREHVDQLTLDQAAVLADFDHDAAAVEMLVQAVAEGQFDHAVARLRAEQAERDGITAAADQARADGLTVVDDPRWGEDGTVCSLIRLTDADGQDLEPDTHRRDCPGHVVYVTVRHGWGEDSDESRLNPACADPAQYGHTDRWAGSGYNPQTGSRKKAADMTETERETAKAERRHVIASNKAWAAATDVRRAWLAEFVTRKTAPKAAENYLAAAITGGWPHSRQLDETVLTLAGFHPTTNSEAHSWTIAAELRGHAESAATTAASPKHALQIAVRLTVAQWEAGTTKDTWRSYSNDTTTTLAALASWGYQLSDIEQTMITNHADETMTVDNSDADGKTAASS